MKNSSGNNPYILKILMVFLPFEKIIEFVRFDGYSHDLILFHIDINSI